ncbi:hypothetical protein F4703DRAFT_1209366 [Phycomyces blakesleeanus]
MVTGFCSGPTAWFWFLVCRGSRTLDMLVFLAGLAFLLAAEEPSAVFDRSVWPGDCRRGEKQHMFSESLRGVTTKGLGVLSTALSGQTVASSGLGLSAHGCSLAVCKFPRVFLIAAVTFSRKVFTYPSSRFLSSCISAN